MLHRYNKTEDIDSDIAKDIATRFDTKFEFINQADHNLKKKIER